MVQVVRVCDAILSASERPEMARPRPPTSPAVEFTWVDVVDILIVAFLVYQLLQFIRGTHAVQMALGGWCWCSSTWSRSGSTWRR